MQGNSSNSWAWTLNRSIPSDTKVSTALISEMLDRIKEVGWSDQDVFGIHMALEEAITNAIKHGNQGDSSKQVHVEFNLAEHRLEVCVTDEGEGFDPEDVPDPTAEENLDKESGRGLLLMRSFMNFVEFSEQGNSVSMWKEREPATS